MIDRKPKAQTVDIDATLELPHVRAKPSFRLCRWIASEEGEFHAKSILQPQQFPEVLPSEVRNVITVDPFNHLGGTLEQQLESGRILGDENTKATWVCCNSFSAI